MKNYHSQNTEMALEQLRAQEEEEALGQNFVCEFSRP